MTFYLHPVIRLIHITGELNNNHYIPTGSVFSQAIHSIWQVEGYTSFQKEHIIPKGIVEIIFNFSGSNAMPVRVGEKQYSLASCFINGFNTSPLEVQLPAQQKFFGIQLQPLAVKKIFGVPAREFSNHVVDLSLLDPVFLSLWHQLAEQTGFDGEGSCLYRMAGKKTAGMATTGNTH